MCDCGVKKSHCGDHGCQCGCERKHECHCGDHECPCGFEKKHECHCGDHECPCGCGKKHECHCENHECGCCKSKGQKQISLVPECISVLHGDEPMEGKFFFCIDCDPEIKYPICEACATFCHTDHNLILIATEEKKICHCGKLVLSKCIIKSHFPICTFLKTGKTFIQEKSYFCKDCMTDPSQSCCKDCAEICHRGHNIVESDQLRYYCSCGAHQLKTPCTFVPGDHEHLDFSEEEDDFPEEETQEVSQAPPPICSFSQTGGTFHPMEVYKCLTCGIGVDPNDGFCICKSCAEVCHKGHDVRLDPLKSEMRAYCDCGSGGTKIKCKCCPRKPCTFEIYGGKSQTGMIWHCRTCGLEGNLAICASCIQACHKGHDVFVDPAEPIGNFICACGRGEKPLKETTQCKIVDPKKQSPAISSNELTSEPSPGDRLMCSCFGNPKRKVSLANIPVVWLCTDCHMSICSACAKKCHAGHHVERIGFTDHSFQCDCGCGRNEPKFECKCMPKYKMEACTYYIRHDIMLQRTFKCEDCNCLICKACARKCHINHKVVDLGMQTISCMCQKDKCKAPMVKPEDMPIVENPKFCTQPYQSLNGPELLQPCFFCQTCDQQLCKACALKCHSFKGKHKLVYCGMERFTCTCTDCLSRIN